MNKTKRFSFVRGAAVLTAGALLSKAVGAVYRVPLTSFLGSYGTGLYQMAYPLFLLFLTFSSAGIPAAISRAVARETALWRSPQSVVAPALKLFGGAGLLGAVLMCLFAPFMCAVQGESNLLLCYFALAPSVFLVAAISVLRGYFQGVRNMAPTALSEVIESVVKAGAGVLLLTLFRQPAVAAAGALLCVTLSESAALLFLWRRYQGERKIKSLRPVSAPALLFHVLPVMLAAALLPLSRTLDSVIIVRLMARYERRAVPLYGLFTGGAVALIDLPASLAAGLAAVAVPGVSALFARGDEEGGRGRCALALLYTLLLAAPCALLLFFFAEPILRLLYPALEGGDFAVLVSLLKLSSVSAASLAAVNTLSACLTGMGRAKHAARAMAIAVFVKFLLQILWVRNPAISVLGAAASMNACYLVAFFLDWVYTFKKNTGRKKHDNRNRLGNAERRAHVARKERAQTRGQNIGA